MIMENFYTQLKSKPAKKKHLKSFVLLAIIMSLGMILSSCGGDSADPIPKPKADFSVEVKGKTVTFTNKSVAEGEKVTYAWDFNDESTSEEMSPSHTYEANGTYLVKLTVKNESGTDEKSSVLEIVNIKIDGDFSDWDDVTAVSNTGKGSLTKMKVDNLGKDKLFFYVEGTSEMTSFFDLYLDLDHDPTGASDTTGYRASVYPKAGPVGCDVLFEGFFGSTTGREGNGMFYGIFFASKDDDSEVGFGDRDEPAIDPNMMAYTDLKAVGDGFALEFSIDLKFLPERVKVSEEIQLFIDEWANKASEAEDKWWSGYTGNFPEQDQEESLPVRYKFK